MLGSKISLRFRAFRRLVGMEIILLVLKIVLVVVTIFKILLEIKKHNRRDDNS